MLEIKCPFTRKTAVNKIPALYRDQVQTGLALSGELVTKGLFVDCCFRMCALSHLGMNLNHNPTQHHTFHRTKTPFPQAWGICTLESKYKCTPRQAALLNLGTTKSNDTFETTLLAYRDVKQADQACCTRAVGPRCRAPGVGKSMPVLPVFLSGSYQVLASVSQCMPVYPSACQYPTSTPSTSSKLDKPEFSN